MGGFEEDIELYFYISLERERDLYKSFIKINIFFSSMIYQRERKNLDHTCSPRRVLVRPSDNLWNSTLVFKYFLFINEKSSTHFGRKCTTLEKKVRTTTNTLSFLCFISRYHSFLLIVSCSDFTDIRFITPSGKEERTMGIRINLVVGILKDKSE